MQQRRFRPSTLPAVLAAAALALLASTGAVADEHAPADLLPNLEALPASELHVKTTQIAGEPARRDLLFSARLWNSGTGPIEIEGTDEVIEGKRRVLQNIYDSAGGVRQIEAGLMEHHEGHGHLHLDDYARYEIRPADDLTTLLTGSKVSFCLRDNARADPALPGSPEDATYVFCAGLQGISVGWIDVYSYVLPGQALDITALPDGHYVLAITVNPTGALVESDPEDNTSLRYFALSAGGTVVTLEDPPPPPGEEEPPPPEPLRTYLPFITTD